MDKYIDKLTKEDCKEIFDNLWLRTTEFMKITGMTEGQYRNCYRQWKKWGLDKIIRKKGQITYVSLLAFNKFVSEMSDNEEE